MATFLFSYHTPAGYVPARPGSRPAWPAWAWPAWAAWASPASAAWPAWFQGMVGQFATRTRPRAEGEADMFDVDRGTLRPGGTVAAAPASRLVTVLLTSVAYFMVTLDALVVVTALPSIHRQLGGGVATLHWTVSAYTMAFGAGIITAAALGDRLGRRRVYTAGLLIFTLASAACAVAPDAGALIACRAVQGLGAACIMPLGLTLLTAAFPPRQRGAAVGIWGGIAGLAVASGPLVGGSITQGLSWHWIFWVSVPIGILAAVGARLKLAESHGPVAPLDVPALVLVTAGVGLLIWGIVEGGAERLGIGQRPWPG